MQINRICLSVTEAHADAMVYRDSLRNLTGKLDALATSLDDGASDDMHAGRPSSTDVGSAAADTEDGDLGPLSPDGRQFALKAEQSTPPFPPIFPIPPPTFLFIWGSIASHVCSSNVQSEGV